MTWDDDLGEEFKLKEFVEVTLGTLKGERGFIVKRRNKNFVYIELVSSDKKRNGKRKKVREAYLVKIGRS